MSPRAVWLLLLLAAPAAAQSPFIRGSDTRTLPPEAVMRERSVWGLDLSFGGTRTRGNVTQDQAQGSASAFRRSGRHNGYLAGSGLFQRTNGRTQQKRGSLTVRYDYAVGGPWKVFAFNTQAYHKFIRLDYRTTSGAGPWLDFRLGPTVHSASLAVTHEYEEFEGGVVERAARWSYRHLLRLPVSSVAELRADLFYVPKANDWGDVHGYADVGLQTMVYKDKLGLSLSWIYEHDSRPKPGVRRSDSYVVTALNYRLGR